MKTTTKTTLLSKGIAISKTGLKTMALAAIIGMSFTACKKDKTMSQHQMLQNRQQTRQN